MNPEIVYQATTLVVLVGCAAVWLAQELKQAGAYKRRMRVLDNGSL